MALERRNGWEVLGGLGEGWHLGGLRALPLGGGHRDVSSRLSDLELGFLGA